MRENDIEQAHTVCKLNKGLNEITSSSIIILVCQVDESHDLACALERFAPSPPRDIFLSVRLQG